MIRHLKHNELDRQRWDEAIAAAANALPYAESWWLDTVSPGWEALVEDDYVTVMPLTKKRKFSMAYLAQPHFTQQLGLFSALPIDAQKVAEFMAAIPAEIKLVEICLNATNPVSAVKFDQLQLLNHEVSLHLTYEELKAAFSDNTKRNIRKAAKAGVSIARSELSIGEVIAHFQAGKGKELKGLNDDYYATLEKLFAVAHKRGFAQLWEARSAEKELLAVTFFLSSPSRSLFLFSSTLPRGKEQGAMPALIDRFMFENSGKPMILDFEGSVNPNLARFYAGFGANKSIYFQVTHNRLPRMVKWMKAPKDNGS